MKNDQLHLRSAAAGIVRDLAYKTGMSYSDITDALILWAAERITLAPVEPVITYKIVFPDDTKNPT